MRRAVILVAVGLLSVSVRAAVDTADRRYSVINMAGYVLPVPNSEIDAEDRLHLLGLYAGLGSGDDPVTPCSTDCQRNRRISISIGIGL